MYDLCDCTAPAALETIPGGANTCIPGKIAKLIFQRRSEANYFIGSLATPVGTNPISAEASWTGLPAAVDDTKVVITPFTEEVEFSEQDLLEDSENFDGAPIGIDVSPTLFTFTIRNISNTQFDALKSLQCERDLVCIMVDARSNFWVREVATDTHTGFTISPDTFLMRDPSRGTGKVDQFKAMGQFYIASSWYAEAVKITPEAGFDPLTEIVAP
jgi:hypothetical protein